MLYAPIFPLIRAPARIGMGRPFAERPMRRVKKRSTSWGAPNWKVCAFSRKNGRFSGKNRGNRVRLTCCSSDSTWAKSVFTVKSAVMLGVTPHFTSTPTSNWFLRWSTRARLSSSVRPAPYGVTLMSRRPGRSSPSILAASETRWTL